MVGIVELWIEGDGIVFTSADAQKKGARQKKKSPGEDQQPWTFSVEDRPDLDAAEESKENVETEDPADGALTVIAQLVRAEVGLEGPDRVHHPEGCQHATERAEHDEPCTQTTFGVGDLLLRLDRGRITQRLFALIWKTDRTGLILRNIALLLCVRLASAYLVRSRYLWCIHPDSRNGRIRGVHSMSVGFVGHQFVALQ